MAVGKSAGDKVIGGTLNQSGAFVMRADKIGRDTVLAQIVQMVAQAQRSRAPIQTACGPGFRLVCAAGHRGRHCRIHALGRYGVPSRA